MAVLPRDDILGVGADTDDTLLDQPDGAAVTQDEPAFFSFAGGVRVSGCPIKEAPVI